MKHTQSNERSNDSHAAANSPGKTEKSSSLYQINDKRSTSVMQRKFRNLANGLASANIIQNKESKPLQSKITSNLLDKINAAD
jgi:hypothetical protein